MTPRRGVDPSRGAGGTPSRAGSPRRLVGRYRLDAELGRGAMGTVWRAYDEVLHRPVAVKEVRLSSVPVSERAVVRERTLREARATAMLSHPNVVTLYDVVEVDGEPYVVMELLPSRSLAAQIMEDGPLSAAEAASVGSAVASALITAHRAGITHRDVKPGNVLIGGPGQIKLTDFGIARNAAESSMTQTGTVLGSPPYIAPEVAMGRGVGPAADLWGLGATLFACVEGRPPYDAGNPVSTVSEVVHGDVPLPTGHGPVVDVIRGLMVKDPALRMPLGAVRRRLRPVLPRPEEGGVPGVSGAPVGRTPAPPSPDSDHSGLIPIPHTRPFPEPASGPLPEPPTGSGPGPSTAPSPEARPDPSEPDDADGEHGARGGGGGEPGGANGTSGPQEGSEGAVGGEQVAGGTGEPAAANGTPAPQEGGDGAVRPTAGITARGDAADATGDDTGDGTNGSTAAPGAAEGADVSAAARALPAEAPPDAGPPGAGGIGEDAGGTTDGGAAGEDGGRGDLGGQDAGAQDAAGHDAAGHDAAGVNAPGVNAPGQDATGEKATDPLPGEDVAGDPAERGDREGETPAGPVPDEAEPHDRTENDPEVTAGPHPTAAATPDSTPEHGPEHGPRPPDAPGPSASEPTRVVAVPSTAARTEVTPRVGTDGPTRRVPRRAPSRSAAPPPAPASRPVVPPPPRPGPAEPAPAAAGAGPGLAPDPGPLPFAPRAAPAPPPTRIVAAVVALLVVLAILGAVVGYALVRGLGA